MPAVLRQDHAIRLRCRDFTFVAFHFSDETQARSVYDSIKALTCGLGSFDKLYAFTYDPPPIEKNINGWEIYDARKEYKRMGISPKGADRGWRLTDINRDYEVRCHYTFFAGSSTNFSSTRPPTLRSWSCRLPSPTTFSNMEENTVRATVSPL